MSVKPIQLLMFPKNKRVSTGQKIKDIDYNIQISLTYLSFTFAKYPLRGYHPRDNVIVKIIRKLIDIKCNLITLLTIIM